MQATGCVHLSVDDVISSLHDLSTRPYASLWDQPFFAFLKRMNDVWGAAFSLYVFHSTPDWDLSLMNTRYRDEFQAASGWLKLGFHAFGADTRYDGSGATAQEALDHYRATVRAIRAFAGDEAVDTFPRAHRFEGTLAMARAWRDVDGFGIRGLLSADDDRVSYYHTRRQRDALLKVGRLCDGAEGMCFVRTDLRLENEADPAGALAAMVHDGASSGAQQGMVCVFTHEQHFDSAMEGKINAVCRWAVSSGFAFGFPADHIQRS